MENNIKNGYGDDFTKSTLSEIYAELSNFGKAEKLILEILEKNPDNLSYLGNLAEIYIKERDYNKALEYIKNAKYPLGKGTITSDYQYGVSNEVLPGQTAEVTLEKGVLLLVMVW